MQPITAPVQQIGAAFVQASVVNGFALLGFSDGLTVVFDASTIRQLLAYAEFVYNAPMTSDMLPESLYVEQF